MFRVGALLSYLTAVALFCTNALGESIPTDSSVVSAAAMSPMSATLGNEIATYHAQRTATGFGFENPGHNLKADLNSSGLELLTDGGHCHIQLLTYGRGDALENAQTVAPRNDRNRVEYIRAFLTEWYTNGPAGLEQGFTVNNRVPDRSDQPLTLTMEISGRIVANQSRHDGLTLIKSAGTPWLEYTGLRASDAKGRELPAWHEFRNGRLVLKVDDRSAVYPIVIDPWIQRAKLTASDGHSGDMLGFSIAVSGDTVVVGAPLSGSAAQGAVYVFVKPASGWKNVTQVAKLTATDAIDEDEIGFAVDIDDDKIVAGAPVVGFNDKPGAVYVYVKPATGWHDMTETAELLPSDGLAFDQLGWFVSLSGDTIVGGALSAGPNGLGLVYLYTKPATGWKNMSESAILSASHGGGVSGWLSIDHDTVVAGGVTGMGKEAAFVYVKPVTGWKKTITETATLEASDNLPQDLFGTSTYIEGDTIVVGAPEATIGANQHQGAGYVFVKPAGGWKGRLRQIAKLTSSDGQAQDQLGWSAAMFENTLVLGANGAHVKGVPTGAVYVYIRPQNGWRNMTQKFKLFAKHGIGIEAFGNAVSISGTTLAIGAPGAAGHSVATGAGYVFESVK